MNSLPETLLTSCFKYQHGENKNKIHMKNAVLPDLIKLVIQKPVYIYKMSWYDDYTKTGRSHTDMYFYNKEHTTWCKMCNCKTRRIKVKITSDKYDMAVFNSQKPANVYDT